MSSTTVLCDSHVHIYDCFNLDVFFDSAWNNFYKQAQLQQIQSDFLSILLLSEAKQDHWFLKLKENQTAAGDWLFHETDESSSLYAQNGDGDRILVINGRQIVTSENLEVLALATANELPDGKPIADVVEWAIDNNAMPVIPWGFGKWWGSRGNVLSKTLESFSADELFLGDNGGRPWFLGKPGHFTVAESEQRRILPGSDPLPFSSESWRPGSVGFSMTGTVDHDAPAKSLRHLLKDQNTTIAPYMHCERLLPFMRNQVAMQIKKRI